MESSRLKNMENRVMAEMADDAKIIETVVRAHFDSCDYTSDKIKPFIAKAMAEKQLTQCTGMVSTEHLNTCLNSVTPPQLLLCNCLTVLHKSFDNLLKPFIRSSRWGWPAVGNVVTMMTTIISESVYGCLSDNIREGQWSAQGWWPPQRMSTT